MPKRKDQRKTSYSIRLIHYLQFMRYFQYPCQSQLIIRRFIAPLDHGMQNQHVNRLLYRRLKKEVRAELHNSHNDRKAHVQIPGVVKHDHSRRMVRQENRKQRNEQFLSMRRNWWLKKYSLIFSPLKK